MTPDAETRHDPRCAPSLLAALSAAGIGNADAARRIGVHRNHIANLKRGTRDGRPVTISYADQFALECLLEAAEALRSK